MSRIPHPRSLKRCSKQVSQQPNHVLRSLLEDLQKAKDKLETQRNDLESVNSRLEELSQLKDEFVASVSHELRTPLTAIKEGISLMLDRALGEINDEQRDFLTTVDENIDRLTELISNMLDLSKIEAGRLHLARRRVDVRQLLETTLNSYRVMAAQRRVEVEINPVPEVYVDPNRILQVLGNLFSNAVKFTPEDGTITLSLEVREGIVAVSVTDTGVGMASEDLPRLFQKFSQVGEGQTRFRGTGLGLALCKELVELHKGMITVTSALGRGTRFTFTLPQYTSSFVLQESFTELVERAKRTSQEMVALLVLDCEPLLGRLPAIQVEQRRWHLDQMVTLMRKHTHQEDVVLHVEPYSVVILAMTDLKGVEAITARLQGVLSEWAPTIVGASVRFPLTVGSALFPLDGNDAQTLLEKAQQVMRRKEPLGLTTSLTPSTSGRVSK